MVFISGEVATALVPSEGVPKELSAPVIVKKLGYVVEYARFGTLTPATTKGDIVCPLLCLLSSTLQLPYYLQNATKVVFLSWESTDSYVYIPVISDGTPLKNRGTTKTIYVDLRRIPVVRRDS